jgi:hypothetical protein
MPLQRPAAGYSTVLHDAPRAVLLAVLMAKLWQRNITQPSKAAARFARPLVGTAHGFSRFAPTQAALFLD